MPFKKRRDGSVIYDENGILKIPTNKDTFTKERPPLRDGANRPLVPGSWDKIDWVRWAEEIEEARKNASQ